MHRLFIVALVAVLLVSLPLGVSADEAYQLGKTGRVVDPAVGWQKHFELWAIVSTIIFLVVFLPMLYFIFKYRRKKEGEDGAYIEGHLGLEIAWTAIPLIIIVLLGVQSWALFNDYRDVPPNAHEIKVEAFQYGFDMVTPEGIKTINKITVPKGPVKLSMTSRDVVHNFAIPDFRVREDTVPGRMTYMWFDANKIGVHKVYCAELCGPGHSDMLAEVTVVSKEDYAKWVEAKKIETQTKSPVAKGEEHFKSMGCANCHSTDGSEGVGPSIKGLWGAKVPLERGDTVTVDDAFLAKKIKDAKAEPVKGFPPVMPSYSGISNDDLEALVAYIKTVK